MLFDDKKSAGAAALFMSLPRLLLGRSRLASSKGATAARSGGGTTLSWGPAIESLRARLRDDVDADRTRGISAGVVAGDRLIWAEGFGFADPDTNKPATPDTLYRIGSVSKVITAAALMRLVERGVVNLDDRLATHVSEARGFVRAQPDAAPITLRHLATHTSGMIREPRLEGAASGPVSHWEEKLLESIPTASFDTLPGTCYSYSDFGYGMLGLAMQRATGVEFMDLIEREIFRPLAMHQSTFVIPESQRQLLSKGYTKERSGRGDDSDSPAREHFGRGYKVPSGGIYSCVGDMARLIGGITGAFGDAILNKESRTLMLTRHTPPAGEGYGVGVWLKELRGVMIAGHGGSVSGYTMHIAFEAQSGLGVILLRNYDSGRRKLVNTANEALLMLLGK